MWNRKHVISIDDFSREDIDDVLAEGKSMWKVLQQGKTLDTLKGRILATLFFEPSTRTRLSFESAMQRLGGSTLGFGSPNVSSRNKGETTADTIRTVAGYADAIVIRHYAPGTARLASEVSEVPILNGGDGDNQHPTQTILDLLTIREELGTLKNLNITMVGDLKYGRTVHSLVTALKLFNCKFNLISPDSLKLPPQFLKGCTCEETSDLDLKGADVVYVTRIQKERFGDTTEYEKVKGVYVVDPNGMKAMQKKSLLMHPLPRVSEIDWRCDSDPRSVYFKQSAYGVAARMALLKMLLGGDKK